MSVAGVRSRGCCPYHQCSDFDLLILGLLIDLLQECHPVGDDEGGPAQLGGGVDESFHSHQLVNLPLRPTQGNHHLHDSLHAKQLVAQVKGPLQNSRHHLDGMERLIHVLGVNFAPARDIQSQHMEQQLLTVHINPLSSDHPPSDQELKYLYIWETAEPKFM